MSINIPSFSWNVTLQELLIVILVGLVAGFLASRVVSGHGYGVFGDIVVGVVGALIGAYLLGAFINDHLLVPLGVAAGSIVARIIVAFIGAIILLAVLHLLTGRRSDSRGRSWRRG
jgi:uncharacterized membrane protein YeaQ/YmgE (transglycosylase-associated protein family)